MHHLAASLMIVLGVISFSAYGSDSELKTASEEKNVVDQKSEAEQKAAAELSAYKMKVTMLHGLLRGECPRWAEQYEREIEKRDAVETNVEVVKILYHRLENRLIECRSSENRGERSKQNKIVEADAETTTQTYLLKITKQGIQSTRQTTSTQNTKQGVQSTIQTTGTPNTKPSLISLRHRLTTYVLPTMQVLTMATVKTNPTHSMFRRLGKMTIDSG